MTEIGEGLSPEFRMSRVDNLDGETFFNFNKGFESGFIDQILISAVVSPAGEAQIDLSTLPLDTVSLPILAERYIAETGRISSRETIENRTIIKSDDGDIEFTSNQQTTVEPRPVYVSIKLAPPKSTKDSVVGLSGIVAAIKPIPEPEAVKMLSMIEKERQAKIS